MRSQEKSLEVDILGTSIKKTIKSHQVANNSIIKTDSEILKETESFYRQLYSSCSPQVDDTYANIFFPEENTDAR